MSSNNDTQKLVTAPHLLWFQNWRSGQEKPDEWRYVYKLDQLRYQRDITLYVVGGGNVQLLCDPGFKSLCEFQHIEVYYLA